MDFPEPDAKTFASRFDKHRTNREMPAIDRNLHKNHQQVTTNKKEQLNVILASLYQQ